MSTGGAKAGGGSGNRVSIPSNVRKTIQNIKEITGSHSEEDIYAMLKECSMDPNETTNKLLLQDTFHEVRRKRDRKKENQIKDPAESRWKPGMQGRGNRGGRGTHSSRNILYDATVGGKNTASAKDNAPNQDSEKGVNISSLPISSEIKSKEENSVTSSLTTKANGPTSLVSGSMTVIHDSHTSTYSDTGKLPEQWASSQANKKSATVSGTWEQYGQQVPDSSDCSTSMAPGDYFLSSDPVLSTSQDFQLSGDVDTSKSGVGTEQTVGEEISANADSTKSISGGVESGSSGVQGKMPSKSHGVGKSQHLESSQTASSLHTNPPFSRPSSNYGSRLQAIGPQKVGPNKEWKPKSSIHNLTQGSEAVTASEAPAISVEASMPEALNSLDSKELNALDSKEANVELQKKLEELCISGGQHVIIPNHLHVPEVEKLGFCFGSFDASFGTNTSYNTNPENDQTAPISEASDGSEEAAEEQFSSNQNAFGTVDEVDYPENNQSSSYGPENLSSEGGVSSSNITEFNGSKQETTPEGHEYSSAHTSNYSFGFMPPILGSQLPPFETSESQACDVSRVPTFVVQQPFDPTSYYAQFYRSGADSDGRISPFHSAGIATKYSGNLNMVSPQSSQSPLEVCNPAVLSTAAPTPLVSQAAGIMQSSMGATQPLSVFRPPAGLHLPHYPSNYIPYGHYISPFYIPQPAIHQFLGNGAFPQQPQGGNIYPALPAAAAKFLQFKPGTNTNNSGHVGIPGSYVTYSSPMANYNFSSATAAGNSNANEDLASSHFKENNAYTSGQQSEGSGVWINPSGRDISSIQASSFYNLAQGQMAFAPAQPGHGTFAGLYHPAAPVNPAAVHPLLQQSQTMASPVDMVGPTASVYQQPQHSQINWPNNF